MVQQSVACVSNHSGDGGAGGHVICNNGPTIRANNTMSRRLTMCNMQTNTLTNVEITTGPRLESVAQKEMDHSESWNSCATNWPLQTCSTHTHIHILSCHNTHPHRATPLYCVPLALFAFVVASLPNAYLK